MENKKSPFKLDDYKSRFGRMEQLEKPDNVYAKTWFSNLAVLVFVFIDLFCLKTVWNLVQTEDPLYVWCVAFACAIALDVPLAIAAIALKRYRQGVCSKVESNTILILSVTVFAIAFFFSFGFRVVTKDLSFDIGTGSTLTNTLSSATEQETSSPGILVAALFNGVIPLLTSISSFVISYFSYEPLKLKLLKLKKERIGLQANMIEARQALSEAGSAEDFCDSLISRENDLYQEFMEQLDADALVLKQQLRLMLAGRLGTPEDITEISKSSQEVAQKYPIENTPGQELPKHIDKMMSRAESEEAADGEASEEESEEVSEETPEEESEDTTGEETIKETDNTDQESSAA